MKVEIEIDQALADGLATLAGKDSRTLEQFAGLILERWVFGQAGRNYRPPSVAEIEQFRRERARPKREALTAKQRNRVFEECDGVCSYCRGVVLYDEPWDVDHIVPVAKGGTNDPRNLTLSCVTCNLKKHIKAVA